MNDDQFTKLFTYIQKEFAGVHEKLDSKASQESLDRPTNTIDSFVKRLDDAEIEQASREVSAKTGIPLRNL